MKKYALGLILITCISSTAYYLYTKHNPFTYYSDEVHVHADFLIIVNDSRIDLSDEKYQSSAETIRHKNVHLHDGVDTVLHRHAEGITFAEFMSSLGFSLTDNCLINDNGESFCTNAENVLTLYVNENPVTEVTTYIPQEEDRILLYYGTPNNPNISDYQAAVTDESCIYSGTCKERGTAPPESCGLTCEI